MLTILHAKCYHSVIYEAEALGNLAMVNDENITKAAAILRAGGLAAIPTETVYGLGADAGNEAAIRKIFAAKQRPYDHPLIVHLADIQQLSSWAREISPVAMRAARAFWPGPLTIILKKQPHVLDIVTGGQDTVGLRIPRHPIAHALLQAFGSGIAAPSANKFTHISPTTAEAVREELGDKVDIILDGGDCEVGLESTIVDFTADRPIILRPGMITAEALTQTLGMPIISARHDNPVAQQNNSATRVPGMHHLHYAPTTKTLLIEAKNIVAYLASLQTNDLPVAVVTQNDFKNLKFKGSIFENSCHVQLSCDATAYAHDIYRVLRALDNQAFKCILVAMVPAGSEWDAVRDRLNKASGGRG